MNRWKGTGSINGWTIPIFSLEPKVIKKFWSKVKSWSLCKLVKLELVGLSVSEIPCAMLQGIAKKKMWAMFHVIAKIKHVHHSVHINSYFQMFWNLKKYFSVHVRHASWDTKNKASGSECWHYILFPNVLKLKNTYFVQIVPRQPCFME